MSQWQAQEVGTLVRNRRRELNLSVRQVARQAHIDRATLSRIEVGAIANPSTATLQAVAGTLGLSLSQLFAVGSPDTPATPLPTLAPYLRIKYPDLSDQAVAEMGHYFDYLQARYGEHRPAEGDDER